MKTIVFSILLFLSLLIFKAQGVYSIQGEGDRAIQFNSIVEINSNQTLLSAQDDFSKFNTSVRNVNLDAPNSKLMASLAYDAKSNSLIYMPMISSYVYIKKGNKTNLISIDAISEITSVACNQGSQFSRMTMAPDGNAYALSNNFNELIKINPSTHQVENIGAVKVSGIDPFKDKTAWGGDLIADTENNLYAISAQGKVFKIDVKNRSAQLEGNIKNLPENYTTNGAAVLADGRVMVSNAQGKSTYTFDINDLEAKEYNVKVPSSYDLASQFFVNAQPALELANSKNGLQIYPTIIDRKELNVLSDKNLKNVTVRIYDTNSFLVQEFKSQNMYKKLEQNFSLKNIRPNIYIVKIFDKNGAELLSQKVTVTK